jgi:hypothetical protein
MTSLHTILIGAVLAGVTGIAVEVSSIHAERSSAAASVTSSADSAGLTDPDDLVFLKRERPSSPADLKQLTGTTVWVSAAGQMEYYPYAAQHADFAKPVGTLLGATPLLIQEPFEQVAPKQAQDRIPVGDKQVLLAFTMPTSADPSRQYAVPVGYQKGSDYSFLTDDLFFYANPHDLYKHWGPKVWKAVDSHQVILGMNELQTQLSLGQVSSSASQDLGNRVVIYANLGKPEAVTFVKDHATAFRAD